MKNQVPTPHIGAQYGEIAKTMIMAGDPLRAKFMADRFLENPRQINNVRSMLGFTGTYHGKEISVMGHGMGIPSIGIYSYELYNFYDVDTIIRVGSCGARQTYVHLGDLIIAMGCCTDSNYAAQYNLPGTYAPIADFGLVRAAVDACERLGYRYFVGNVFSADIFYYLHRKRPYPHRRSHHCRAAAKLLHADDGCCFLNGLILKRLPTRSVKMRPCRVILMLMSVLLFSACHTAKFVPEGKYLLYKTRIVVNDTHDVNPNDLKGYLKQTHNTEILGFWKLQ